MDDNGDYVLYTAHAAEAERLTAERDAAIARAKMAEGDAAHFCAGLCVHPRGVIGDEGGSACCPITGTRDAIAADASTMGGEREQRLMELAEYVGSDKVLGQLTRIFGSAQQELVELRRLLTAVAEIEGK